MYSDRPGDFVPDMYFGRKPFWREKFLLLPHPCSKCSRMVWGRGHIGPVYWVMGIDTYYAHNECLILEALARG